MFLTLLAITLSCHAYVFGHSIGMCNPAEYLIIILYYMVLNYLGGSIWMTCIGFVMLVYRWCLPLLMAGQHNVALTALLILVQKNLLTETEYNTQFWLFAKGHDHNKSQQRTITQNTSKEKKDACC